MLRMKQHQWSVCTHLTDFTGVYICRVGEYWSLNLSRGVISLFILNTVEIFFICNVKYSYKPNVGGVQSGKKKGIYSESLEKKCSLTENLQKKIVHINSSLESNNSILCIYSANLHPNWEDIGFVSLNTEIFEKINKGKCFLQKQEEITLHSFVCASVGNYGQHDHTISVKCTFSVTK